MDFQSEIKELDAVTREVIVKVPQTTIEDQAKAKLKKLAAQAKIKGFRPGKAPQAMVESMYGAQVRYEVLNDATLKSLDQVIAKNAWRIVGSPEVDFKTAEGEMGDLEYTAKVFLYPTPEIAGYESFKVTVDKRTIKDQDILDVINRHLEEQAEIKDVTDREALQDGDIARGELAEKTACNHGAEENCEHEHHEHVHTEPVVFKVGSGRWSLELEKQALGQKKGETRKLSFSPSKDAPEGAKAREFDFTLKEIQTQVMPEVTDELVKGLGIPGVETLAAWKEQLQKELEQEEERLGHERVQGEIVKQLSAAHDFAIPKVMIEDEIRGMVKAEYQKYGQQIEDKDIPVEHFREAFEKAAVERIKNGVILFTIAEKENLVATTMDVKAMLDKFQADFRIAEDKLKKYLAEDGRWSRMKNDISLKKVFEFLEARAEVTHKEV